MGSLFNKKAERLDFGEENLHILCYNRSYFRYRRGGDRFMQEAQWEKTLRRLKRELAEAGQPELLGRAEQLERELRAALSDVVDIREFCENSGQALCITDGQGHITYMNDLYAQETRLRASEALGKPEPFQEPISRQVMERQQPVTFGNDGSRLEGNGRIVSGVPVWGPDGSLRHIVITLSTEELIYQRYQELRKLMNKKETVRIIEGEDALQSLLGKNPEIREIRSLIRRAAPTDATVLITGESGSGKEVVADCIYGMSRRKDKPFVKINCAAIPPNLLEAELFGYERGAFTGANARKIGLFEMANHGTILLDEIGDFPPELQPKLLRVLQQGELYRIGCSTPVKLDVRVIAATNADLKRRMQAGTFREDLYYRLSVFPVRVPPLRERREDILGLANYFLERYGKKYGRTVTLPRDICQVLEQYDWPGNVREMQNVIEYYVICSDEGNEMSLEQLTRVLQLSKQDAPAGARFPPVVQPAAGGSGGTLFQLRDNFEKQLIEDALRQCSSARQAARMLGIFPSSLYRKAQKYNIQISEEGTQ